MRSSGRRAFMTLLLLPIGSCSPGRHAREAQYVHEAPGYALHRGYNCFEGAGASDVVDVNVHVSSGEVDGADRGKIATLKCKQRCDTRDGCSGFTT